MPPKITITDICPLVRAVIRFRVIGLLYRVAVAVSRVKVAI